MRRRVVFTSAKRTPASRRATRAPGRASATAAKTIDFRPAKSAELRRARLEAGRSAAGVAGVAGPGRRANRLRFRAAHSNVMRKGGAAH